MAGVSIQRRRGTAVETASFTGKLGELTIDTTNFIAVIHDGVTAGGYPLALKNHTHPNATDSTVGFMSAADKTKLDGISGGTVYYQTVQSSGTVQTEREALNLSTAFAITDDSGGNRTNIDLATTGVGASTYTKVTVNTKGQVTAGTLLSASDIPNITSAKLTDFYTAVETVRLDQMTIPTSDINLNGNNIINLSDPVNPSDAATKNYVDATATGLTFKDPCRAASTGNVNINAPGTTIDTVSLNPGDRVLLKNQSTTTANGIYIFNGASSTMTRSLDADVSSEVLPGMFVLVTEGSVNADVGFVLATTGAIILGTTSLSFVAFSSGGGSVSAGNGINVTGSVVSVASANSGRIAVSSSGVDLAVIGGLTPGTYQQFTVDAYGRITATTSNAWQPANASLTALTTFGVNGFVSRTASATFATRTLQNGTGISITNPDGAAGNPSISVQPNTTVQQVIISHAGTQISTRQQLNFIDGSGATLTITDDSGNNRCDITVAAAGGSGAPSTSEYVTLATDGGLSNERVLAVTSPILITDGGAGNNVTIGFTMDWGTVP